MKNRVQILNVELDNLTMSETISIIEDAMDKNEFIQHGAINVAKIMRMRKDHMLYQAVSACDIINIDGMGVVWGAKFLGVPIKERVTGIDLFYKLLALAEKKGKAVFFLGAKEEVLKETIRNIMKIYPKLVIAGSHHGYYGDNADEVAKLIKNSGASMLFIGMTSPMKEIFIERYSRMLDINFAMGVGGTFDIVAGKTKRAPLWMQRYGLEWFFRVLQEPGRLGKRYLVTNSQFIFAIAKEKIRTLFSLKHD